MLRLGMLKLTLDEQYGAFRVFDSTGVVIRSGGMDELTATRLATKVDGRIEHQDPDTGAWYRW